MAPSFTDFESSGFHNEVRTSVGKDKVEPIAVIGFSLKFPQDGDTAEGFWQMLANGRSAMTDVPKDRWNIDSFYHPDVDRHDAMNSRGGHFLKEDVSLFDAPFFSIPAHEAVCMDPQQRSLLETTYHAFENAGIPTSSIIGSRTSCYVGSFSREYEAVINRDPQMQAKYVAVGTGTAMLSNRLSWFYDLRGPSISLDTACSSSLIALHLAVESMRAGESDMSIVAGCNLMLNPETNSVPLSNLGFLGRDGVCYSFDHRANGYARGEGTAVMVLKPLQKAIADNDVIRGVIRNTGTNQDGRTPGITQPSREAQTTLIKETYLKAGLSLTDTGFFEAHGTGTPIGDPREAGAIGDAFKDNRTEPIIVGAVKTNIGHLEGASGLAGLIKTIMILERAIVPPNIHFEKLNPDIKSEEWKVEFPTETIPWPKEGLRRASVNSFGYGGANAHVIVDDAYHYLKARGLQARHRTVAIPPRKVAANGTCNVNEHSTLIARFDRYRLFVWSAYDEGGVERISSRYQDHLKHFHNKTDDYLDNLAYTLATRRSILPWKSFLVEKSINGIQDGLSKKLFSKPLRSSASVDPHLAFVFTGQGAAWYAMGRELSAYSTFRNSLRNAEKYFTFLGSEWKLTDELNRSKETSTVSNPALAQPLCTALQVAMIELLDELDISPTAVIGHSSGELAAAYCAGAISKESAYKIAYYRGALAAKLAQTKQRNGSMIAVAMSATDIETYLDVVAAKLGTGRLIVGCINSPKNITLSGDKECVDLMKSLMDDQQVFSRKLDVPVAYHSPHMQDIASEYVESIYDIIPRTILPAKGAFPAMFSTVTGELITSDAISKPEYWVQNMVSQVKFSPALTGLCESLLHEQPGQTEVAPLCLIEIGPTGALRRPVKETLDANTVMKEVYYDSALSVDVDAVKSVMELVGKLYCRGCKPNILALNTPDHGHKGMELLTDLPEYPFNHSQSYWLESRISQNYRFHEHPRHELLGIRTTDWNPLEAKWRNTIRASELPWIKDHKFNGSELYPAAGMLVMAIEASRQMADSRRRIASYAFERVSFYKALLVNLDPEGVESQFHLRPQRKDATISSDRYSFNLYLHTASDWAEICSGTIVTNYEDEVDNVDSAYARDEKLHKLWKDGRDRCRRFVDSKDVYDNLESFGFKFGPSFQNLEDVYYNDQQQAKADLDPRLWMAKVKDSHVLKDHVIHPTVLDAVMHLTAVAESKGTWNPLRTMVPTKIEKLWISNGLLSHTEGQKLQIFTFPIFQGYRDTEFNSVSYDNIAGEAQIILEGYRATAITSLEPSERLKLSFDVDWKADVDLLTNQQIASVCSAQVKEGDFHDPIFIDKAELLCCFYLKEALNKLSESNFTGDAKHVVKYIEWMKKQVDDYESANPTPRPEEGKPSLKDTKYFLQLRSELGHGPEVDAVNEVGKQLAEILRGEVDALEVLFHSKLAANFYAGKTFVPSNKKTSTFMDLLAHKDPTIQILEIGAGTGGSSSAILEALAKHGQNEKGQARFGQYTYTDISPSFFEAAQNRFSEVVDRMEFKVLDIEQDPTIQGFELGKYDVVVASAVLHAVADLTNTLSNVYKLLKPGGQLVLIEPCNTDALRIPFVFGLLSGWWLSVEEHRYWGPLLSEEGWHTVLQKAGFSGANVTLRDYVDHRHTMSVIISTATYGTSKDDKLPPIPKTKIILGNGTTLKSTLVSSLELELSSLGVAAEVVVFDQLSAADLNDSFCISLLEIDQPLLYGMNTRDWDNLKSIVRFANGVLWLTRGRDKDPSLGIVTGLGRGLRSEFPSLNFVELALEQTCPDDQSAMHAAKVFWKSIKPGQVDHKENEYSQHHGTICINRIVEANYLDDHLAARLAVQKPQPQKLGASDSRLLLTIQNPGLLDTLRFQARGLEELILADGEVEILVKATGLNYKDVLMAVGQIPAKSLGLEFSGIVTRVGSSVAADELRKGDRVCGLAIGAFSTKLRTSSSMVFKIPDDMDFTAAAAFPLSFGIAHHSLINLANLRAGESVLIQSAAGSVGQAAIQIAKAVGAEIYCSVGNQEKKDLISSLYQVPEERIFVGRGVSFKSGFKKLIDGVDVVLNCLPGEGLRNSLTCILPFGRCIDISQSDQRSLEDLPGALLAQNISYSAFNLTLALEKSKILIKRLMASVQKLLLDPQFMTATPLNVYHASEMEEAFRSMQTGKNTGKTIVEFNENDVVPVLQSTDSTYTFPSDGTYLLIGGFGGVGKSSSRWMADRGAKHFILLGRSGAKGQAALDFLDEMKARGVTVAAPPCDVSNEEQLKSVLETCSRTMPPIRGCIQGSMVLRDGLYETMSLEDYHDAVHPKARGSWNLHKYLPRDLDFFILLSSAGGVVGTRGQCNYASGNTYQDSLAHYRTSLGLKCISLDLGLVIGVGFAAEHRDALSNINKLGYRGIREIEYLMMLDYLCDPRLPIPTDPNKAQIVTGLEIPKILKGELTSDAQSAQDWARWVPRPLFRNLTALDGLDQSKTGGNSNGSADVNFDFQAGFAEAGESLTAAARVVALGLKGKLARTLHVPEEDIETQKSIHAYGVDSLLAVELRYWIAREMQADLSIFQIMSDASLGELSWVIAEKSKLFVGAGKDVELAKETRNGMNEV